MCDSGGELVKTQNLIERGVGHDLGDQGNVHGVSGAFGDDVAEEGPADEGEVADEVEGFVAAGLVGETEAAVVEDLGVVEADGGFEGSAPDEAHVAHLVELMLEAEGAGGGDVGGITFGGDFHFEGLAADEGVVKEDVAGEQEAVAGKDGDAFAVAFDADGGFDAEVAAAAAVGANAGGLDHFDELAAGAVEDGYFEVVDLDIGVIDAHGVEDAEQVLGGGDEDALAHEAGGVADFGDVAPEGGDEEVFEVLADEDDAGAGGGGEDADGDGDAGMEANAGAFDGALDGGFVAQML